MGEGGEERGKERGKEETGEERGEAWGTDVEPRSMPMYRTSPCVVAMMAESKGELLKNRVE